MEEIGKGNAQIDWQLSKSKGGIRFESIDYKFFLCTRYSWWSRIQCEKLAEGLQIRGHIVRVLCTGDFDKEEIIDGIEIVRFRPYGAHKEKNIQDVPRWRRLLGHLLDIWNIGNLKRLSQEIDRFAPDVINTNNLYGITPIVWKIAKRKNSVGSYNPGLLPDVSSRRDVVQKTNGEKCVHPGLGCQLHRNLNRIHSKYVDCVTAPSALTLNVLLDDGFSK